MTEYFDYESVAREVGLTAAQLEVIKQGMRLDYPHDDMLYELHVLRVCHSVKAGRSDLSTILRELPDAEASAA